MTGDESTQEPTEADARIAAESLALRRSALDPLRAVAAAEAAGFHADLDERQALSELLERLEGRGSAVLSGDPEGRDRIGTLVVADAWVRGEERVLFVGPRPRAVDRLCARCDRRLVEVRNERGAYAGAGLFWVADLDTAPPGLGGADPFARVVHVGTADDPPWQGPTVWVTDALGGVVAPASTQPPARRHQALPDSVGETVDALLQQSLRCLEPGLGALARRAAAGTNADRGAVLGRLTTRLGRMVRAARAKRSDDGAETARQLASDHDGIDDGMLAEALEAADAGADDVDALEAEHARLEELRAALADANDPVLELLMVRARAALAAGDGGALVLPGRASREAATEALGASVAPGESVDDRLDAARDGAVAVLSLAEHREARLDRVAYAGLRVIADARSPIAEATELVGEGAPSDGVALPPAAVEHEPDADEDQWAHWREVLALEEPSAHPAARDAIRRAREGSPRPWTLAHLRRDEGDALVVVGPSRPWEPTHPTLDEGVFHAELELLRVARVRLERALAGARETWTRGRTRLASRRRAAETAIEEARRRKERALGDDARRDATRALEEAEAAIAPLDDEAEILAETHDAQRQRALERFAVQSTIEVPDQDDGAVPSHPRANVVG